jgi:uncharacterized protein
MGTLGWLLVVAVGIALGFSVGRLWPGTTARITELERERDGAREDLKTYRQEVTRHFETTAALFDKVTADYRGLYEHLAGGARQLGAIRGESVEMPLAEPERRRLAPLEAAPDEPSNAPMDAPETQDERRAERQDERQDEDAAAGKPASPEESEAPKRRPRLKPVVNEADIPRQDEADADQGGPPGDETRDGTGIATGEPEEQRRKTAAK